MEGLITLFQQIEEFYTKSELIQNLVLPIIGVITFWLANKNVKLARQSYVAQGTVIEKDKQIEDLKVLVANQNKKLETLGAMFTVAFGESRISQVTKNKLATLYSNFEKPSSGEVKPIEGANVVAETIKTIVETPVVQEVTKTVIDRIVNGV